MTKTTVLARAGFEVLSVHAGIPRFNVFPGRANPLR